MGAVIHYNKKALIHWFEATFEWDSADGGKPWDDFYYIDYDALVENSLVIDSEFDRILGRRLFETFNISQDLAKKVIKTEYENFMIESRNQRISHFVREFEEVGYISSSIVKKIKQKLNEEMKISDDWVRKANGVYSDLYISKLPTNPVDFEAELKRGAPIGYDKFTTYIPGYYEFESAMFRMVLRSVGLDRIRLKKLKMVVDVPDVFDRGDNLVDSGNDGVVKFSRKYIKPPKVIGVQSGGTEVAHKVEIDNITKEGFLFRLLDEQGNKLSGSLSWVSEGY